MAKFPRKTLNALRPAGFLTGNSSSGAGWRARLSAAQVMLLALEASVGQLVMAVSPIPRASERTNELDIGDGVGRLRLLVPLCNAFH